MPMMLRNRSLSASIPTTFSMRLDSGGDISTKKENIAMTNPVPIISPFDIEFSPPLSLLDQIKPFVFAKLEVDVSFLSWSHAECAMSSNEIIVQHKSICHVLSCLRIMQTPHYLGSLFQSVVPSLNRHVLHTYLDWRYSEMNRLWVWPVHYLLLESCIVSLQRVANHDCRQAFCLFFAFFENSSSIRNESALVDLRGNYESGVMIHQIPKPVIVAFERLCAPYIDHGFVNMPDTANIRGELGNVCFHDLNVSLHPIVDGGLPYLDAIKLHEMVTDLAIRYSLEVQVHAKSNHFGVLLHAFKAFSVAELVMADKARKTLNLAEFGVPVTIFFEFDTLAFRTTKCFVLLLVENRIADLYLLSHLQRKLHSYCMLAFNMTEGCIRARATPCKIGSMYVIVKFTSLRTHFVMCGIDAFEHV